MSNDVHNAATGALDLDDAAAAILGTWEDAGEPSTPETEEATDETVDETIAEESEEVEENDESVQSEEVTEDPDELESDQDQEEDADESEIELNFDDDTLVEIPVDGETKQASIRDLKRLYGQEASLTQKSQSLATERKLATEATAKADAQLQAMLARAQERFKPYQEIDMLVASSQMTPEDFAALRQEARAAESDLSFLTQEADSFYSDIQSQNQAKQAKDVKNCVEVLKREIPDWSNDLYNDIRNHAIASGLPEQAVNQYADPHVLMVLHKAMLYDRTKIVAKTKKARAPSKILRSKKAPPAAADVKVRRQAEAQERLRQSPSGGNDIDDIAAALMANWE